MERDNQKILEELEKKGIPVYSFSRIECINNCKYEAYRTYILNDRNNQIPNIYSVLGGRIHDVLEQMMNNQASESDLYPAMNKELDDMDMLGIEFPKSKDGSDGIRQGWITDMTHFCYSYTKPKGKFETETFLLYETPNKHYIQGYIDLTKYNKDGSISIYDYKTSSMYHGEDIKKHGRQLILYALGKEQEGYVVKEVAWIMLKYCEVFYIGKKTSRSKEETNLSKIIERKNIVKDLRNVIEYKLEKLGFDELDIEVKMLTALDKNEIPSEVANDFIIKPYVMKYDLSDETRKDCIEYIDNTIMQWESLENNENNYPPVSFTKMIKKEVNGKEVEIEKENCFYCYSMCGYSSQTCPYFQTYLETKQKKNEDDDLW